MSRHFLVVGAQRCGTTWLAAQLETRATVAMARPSRPEPKVFLTDLGPGQDLAWYDATFFAHATPGQVLGEKGTSYLDRPDAIDRIRAVLGDVPLVVQLRDPLARAVSHWRFSTRGGLEQRSLEEALTADLEAEQPWDPAVTSVSPYAYVRRGRYAEALRPWLDAFGGLLRVQFLEELLVEPELLAGMLTHIGADPDVSGISREPVNQSEDPHPTVPPTLAETLRAYYSDSDRELVALLGRELPWPSGPRTREDTDR